MSFKTAWSRSESIEGWLTEGQARMLFDAATRVRDGETIVEIGSHHGRSTVILASAKSPGVQLLAVDPYGDARWGGGSGAIDIFRSNLRAAGVQNDVTLAREYGAQAGRAWTGGPIGLLFVDGAHDYRTVVSDLAAWLPHLPPDSTVLMHDMYSSPGVTAAAFRHMFGRPNFAYTGSSRSLARFQRASSHGLRVQLVSGIRMVCRLGWLARNLTIKVALRRGSGWMLRWLRHSGSDCPY